MKIYTLTTELWLPRLLEETFPFFADARNLEQLTPPWLHFQILTPDPIEMRPGTVIDYRLRLRGVPLRWHTEITVWEPPHRFVDEQRRGPYRLWIHEHSFSRRDGGTLARDVVRYSVPGGDMVQRFFVQPDLQKIFQYRQQQLQTIFAKPKPMNR